MAASSNEEIEPASVDLTAVGNMDEGIDPISVNGVFVGGASQKVEAANVDPIAVSPNDKPQYEGV